MNVDAGASRLGSDAAVINESLTAPAVFASIFERHFDAIHQFVARRCEAAHVDDVVGATFEVAFRRRSSFQTVADSARPWLYGIAANLLRTESRAARRRSALLPRLFAPAAVDLDVYIGVDADLARALKALKHEHLEVLLLFA